ncbi:hypothetical protein SRHO_G00222680 [Serrasalmus rhombeus]
MILHLPSSLACSSVEAGSSTAADFTQLALITARRSPDPSGGVRQRKRREEPLAIRRDYRSEPRFASRVQPCLSATARPKSPRSLFSERRSPPAAQRCPERVIPQDRRTL